MNKQLLSYILIGIFIIGFVASVVPNYYTRHEITDTVIGKERVTKTTTKGLDSYYLVYCQNETFTIKDTFAYWQYQSSDLYGHLEQGKTYTFQVYGWRSGFFSMYKNIVSYKEKV